MLDFTKYILQKLSVDPSIDAEIKRFFLSQRPGIVYGAGFQSRLTLDFAQFFQKKIDCLLVSPGGTRSMPYYNHVPMFAMDALPDNFDRTRDVIIAIHEKHADEVRALLEENGFSSIFVIRDWAAVNDQIRRLWYQSYFEFNRFVMHADSENLEYYSIACGDGEYKFYFPESDPILQSNVVGELNDIVLPSVLNEYKYLCEGPYEFGDVRLRPGDVVIDGGANVGLFSGVAAAKGCRVYAFEPTPMTLGYLKKNLSFYASASVCPYALCEKPKKIAFNINADLEANASLGSNSILGRGDAFKPIEVDGISLDAFVDKEGLETVDFIKADIEGAERLMLRGAQRTLARFAPRLALCTYHLPDDPEVMERLILEANPNYRIVHKWSKLYAWCPQ